MNKFSSLRAPLSAFLLMAAMAITTTALSFFITPVCDDLGFGRGSFTLYYSLMTAAGACSNIFLGQYINKKGVRGILFLSAIWVCAGFFALSFSSQLWMFYAAGFCMGLCATSCMSLCANVIVQQCCTGDRASSILGLVMAGSGIGGMVISALLPSALEGLGWRMGYRILGLSWLILVILSFLLLGRQNLSNSIGVRKTPLPGMTRKEALKSPVFYSVGFVYVVLIACSGIQQQIPSLMSGLGFDAAQCSFLMTLFTALMAVGKIFQGSLYSKIGIYHGGITMLLCFALSMLCLLSKSLIYPALLLLALGMGTMTTLLPTVARFAFGTREYASIWSILATSGSVASFLTTPVWGMVYDSTGSYRLCLLVCPVLILAATVVLALTLRKTQR